MAPPVVLPWSSINKPAAQLGKAADSLQPLAQRLIRYGGGGAPAGEVGLSMIDYSCPIYQVTMDNKGNPVAPSFWTYFFPTTFSMNQGSQGNIGPGNAMPDNFGWVAGSGNDNIFLVEHRVTGRVWSIWMARQPGYNAINLTNLWNGLAWKTPQHVCGGASVTAPFSPNAITHSERGMGIDKRALIITGEELLSGKIQHAAELTIANTWYCQDVAKAVQGSDFFQPATRCEFSAQQATTRPGYDADKTHLIPEGLRIAFSLTDQEREGWLNTKSFSPNFRRFARLIIDCWCDYGLVVGETGGYGMRSEMTGMLGPDRPIYESFDWTLGTAKQQEYALKTFFNDNASRAWVVQAAP